jgi:hypothetical protein
LPLTPGLNRPSLVRSISFSYFGSLMPPF